MVTKKEKKDRSKLCGQFLVDFVNDKSPQNAAHRIVESVRDELGFPLKRVEDKIDTIKKDQENIKKLFGDIRHGFNLNNNKALKYYLLTYDLCCKPQVDLDEDGSIVVYSVLSQENDYDHIIAYCVITFLESDRCRKLIGKCEECRKYNMYKRTIHRFCPDTNKCRMRYHNRKRIQSGKAKED